MKTYLIPLLAIFLFVSCSDDDDSTTTPMTLPGSLELEFDNVAIEDEVIRQLNLAEPGDTSYNLRNAMGQEFNISLLRYFISNITLEGPNGEYYEDPINVTPDASSGYYLVDESDIESQFVRLNNIPAGTYNKITLTIGVEQDGVDEGAVGGTLDPVSSDMFWSWNSGYVAVMLEGHSDVSQGQAVGRLITRETPKGMAFHIGGWGEPNNNKRITIDLNDIRIERDQHPHVHFYFDVLRIFDGDNQVDFSQNNNMYNPMITGPLADNYQHALIFDHVHQ